MLALLSPPASLPPKPSITIVISKARRCSSLLTLTHRYDLRNNQTNKQKETTTSSPPTLSQTDAPVRLETKTQKTLSRCPRPLPSPFSLLYHQSPFFSSPWTPWRALLVLASYLSLPHDHVWCSLMRLCGGLGRAGRERCYRSPCLLSWNDSRQAARRVHGTGALLPPGNAKRPLARVVLFGAACVCACVRRFTPRRGCTPLTFSLSLSPAGRGFGACAPVSSLFFVQFLFLFFLPVCRVCSP